MKTQLIGGSALVSTRLVYGCMRVAGGWDPAKVTAEQETHGRACIAAAFEAGYNHFDTADIYCRGVCEKILGDALREVDGMRRKALVTTKVGIRFPGDPAPDAPHRYDFSAEHIVRSCEASLRRLRVETIDLYLLHRPDMLMNPPEVAGAFEQLRRAGKVREFGVSNCKPSLVAMLQKFLPMKLVANQVQIHPGQLACLYDGTLDQCLEWGITPQAWSPVGGGMFATGAAVREGHPAREHMQKIAAVLDEVATRNQTTRTVVTLAWLLKHPAQITPVVGSANVERIREAAKADELELSREDWYRVFVAARGKNLP